MTLQAIRYNDGDLSIIDQLQLPYVERYITVQSSEEAWHAIKDMRVRGAPAIAIVATLALASELHKLMACNNIPSEAPEVQAFIAKKLDYLVSSRPTAVNLADAARKLRAVASDHTQRPGSTGRSVATALIQAAEEMLKKDIEDNKNIGKHGAQWIMANAAGKPKATVLTHCNTG